MEERRYEAKVDLGNSVKKKMGTVMGFWRMGMLQLMLIPSVVWMLRLRRRNGSFCTYGFSFKGKNQNHYLSARKM